MFTFTIACLSLFILSAAENSPSLENIQAHDDIVNEKVNLENGRRVDRQLGFELLPYGLRTNLNFEDENTDSIYDPVSAIVKREAYRPRRPLRLSRVSDKRVEHLENRTDDDTDHIAPRRRENPQNIVTDSQESTDQLSGPSMKPGRKDFEYRESDPSSKNLNSRHKEKFPQRKRRRENISANPEDSNSNPLQNHRSTKKQFSPKIRNVYREMANKFDTAEHNTESDETLKTRATENIEASENIQTVYKFRDNTPDTVPVYIPKTPEMYSKIMDDSSSIQSSGITLNSYPSISLNERQIDEYDNNFDHDVRQENNSFIMHDINIENNYQTSENPGSTFTKNLRNIAEPSENPSSTFGLPILSENEVNNDRNKQSFQEQMQIDEISDQANNEKSTHDIQSEIVESEYPAQQRELHTFHELNLPDYTEDNENVRYDTPDKHNNKFNIAKQQENFPEYQIILNEPISHNYQDYNINSDYTVPANEDYYSHHQETNSLRDHNSQTQDYITNAGLKISDNQGGNYYPNNKLSSNFGYMQGGEHPNLSENNEYVTPNYQQSENDFGYNRKTSARPQSMVTTAAYFSNSLRDVETRDPNSFYEDINNIQNFNFQRLPGTQRKKQQEPKMYSSYQTNQGLKEFSSIDINNGNYGIQPINSHSPGFEVSPFREENFQKEQKVTASIQPEKYDSKYLVNPQDEEDQRIQYNSYHPEAETDGGGNIKNNQAYSAHIEEQKYEPQNKDITEHGQSVSVVPSYDVDSPSFSNPTGLQYPNFDQENQDTFSKTRSNDLTSAQYHVSQHQNQEQLKYLDKKPQQHENYQLPHQEHHQEQYQTSQDNIESLRGRGHMTNNIHYQQARTTRKEPHQINNFKSEHHKQPQQITHNKSNANLRDFPKSDTPTNQAQILVSLSNHEMPYNENNKPPHEARKYQRPSSGISFDNNSRQDAFKPTSNDGSNLNFQDIENDTRLKSSYKPYISQDNNNNFNIEQNAPHQPNPKNTPNKHLQNVEKAVYHRPSVSPGSNDNLNFKQISYQSERNKRVSPNSQKEFKGHNRNPTRPILKSQAGMYIRPTTPKLNIDSRTHFGEEDKENNIPIATANIHFRFNLPDEVADT